MKGKKGFQKGNKHGGANKGKKRLTPIWNKGLTKETDERIKKSSIKNGETTRKQYASGKRKSARGFFGKTHTKSWVNTLRKRFSGSNNPQWKGGISFEPYTPQFNIKLKRLIRDRDGHKCKVCCKLGNTVHHINYNKKDCRPENLITLCSSCHGKTNNNRKKWEEFFNED